MADNNLTVNDLLYVFSAMIEKERDLHRLYFTALPVIIAAFDFDKGIVFKYSKRKRCFDPKAGIKKEAVKSIGEKWRLSGSLEEFTDYMLAFDIKTVYETKFNRKIRNLNIPCNDISRSLLDPFITESERIISFEEIKNKRVLQVFTEMELKKALYVPLIAKNSTVGFMLLSPPNRDVKDIKIFSVSLSLAMSTLMDEKEINSLKLFIDYNKEDIEQRQRLYEIGKTASTVAHEIKNSLVGIIGLFNKLKGHIVKSPKADRYIEIIDSELNRMYRFAVDINRYSSGKKSSKKDIFDLRETIDKAIDMTNNINNNFVFSVCIDKEASRIFGDKSQIERVLINLFKNSIEAYNSEDGGKIRIKAKRDGDFVILKITDNSGGVEESKLNEITKPFYTTKAHGTGLGLSIVKEIIREHGGDISFKNTKDGLECIIRLSMPKNITEGKNEQEEGYDS